MAEVFISSDANRKQFKEAIISYLNGTNSIAQTKHNIRTACTYILVKIDAKNFAKNIPLCDNASDENLNQDIIEILTHLEMTTDKRYYTDLGMNSLYDVLTKQKDKNLDYLIQLIDESYPTVHWFNYVYRPLLVTIGVLSLSYMQPQYFWTAIYWIIDTLPAIYHWAYHYVVQLGNLPIIGMAMQIILLVYYLNTTFEYGLDPSDERVRTLLFRAIALTLNFLAHLITYWAAGTLSWIPASIFIASSFIGIIESIYAYWTRKSLPSADEQNTSVHRKAWAARYEKESDRNYYFFLVRLIYATTLTALVLAWTFLVPSVILTMTYMLSMFLAFLVKDYCIQRIKHQSAEDEQIAVLGIYTSPAFNPAGKIEAEKAAFQRYANDMLAKYQDDSDYPTSQMYHAIQTEVIRILSSRTPFNLETSKLRLDAFERGCETVSPTPTAYRLTSSEASLFQSKKAHTSTPQRAIKLDSTFTPGTL